jgi:hypothetical protein
MRLRNRNRATRNRKMLQDDDLSRLAPQDLRRVHAFIEDRFVNAVTPLAMQLQMEMRAIPATGHTLEIAQEAVDRVLAVVEEVRSLVDRSMKIAEGRARNN